MGRSAYFYGGEGHGRWKMLVRIQPAPLKRKNLIIRAGPSELAVGWNCHT